MALISLPSTNVMLNSPPYCLQCMKRCLLLIRLYTTIQHMKNPMRMRLEENVDIIGVGYVEPVIMS
jgi:hypothetical protein